MTLGRLLWTGAGLFGLFLVGLAAYVLVDEPPPDDSDFQFTRTVARDDDNGFAAATVEVPEEMVPADALENEEERREREGDDRLPVRLSWAIMDVGVPFTPDWSADRARKAIALHPTLLLKFEEALRRPKFLAPETEPYHTPPGLSSSRTLLHLATLRAGILFEEGSERDALGEALKIVRLGQRMEQAEGGLTLYLTGASIKMAGAGLIASMVEGSRLSPPELESVLDELGAITLSDEAWRNAVRFEYREMCRMISFMAKRLSRFVLSPNQTRRLALERLRPALRFRAPWNGSGRVLEAEGALPEAGLSWWPPKNLVGKRLVSVQSDVGGMYLRQLGNEYALLATPRLVLALKRYRDARGGLPQRLEELVPEFLEKIPLDPFDGGILKYSREEKTIRLAEGKDALFKLQL